MDRLHPAEIASGIYWVGEGSQTKGLQCNPYLLIDGQEAVLIDPGSVLDFESVWENVCGLVSPDRIRYVILHHQDPDLASSVPLFEKKGCRFQLVAHWRTSTLVRYYGITSEFYILNSHGYQLRLDSGRILSFLPAPYLHFPGAVMTYDALTQTLFSSDLFGSFSGGPALEAGEDYMERMKSFHEHYMPSNEVLRPVMESLLGLPISLIAPQHGSLIRKYIKGHIRALRDLECGSFLHVVKKNLDAAGGYRAACEKILKRYASVYGQPGMQELLMESGLEMDPEGRLQDLEGSGPRWWDQVAESMFARKGMEWLMIAEPLAERLSREYDIPLPEVFSSNLARSDAEIRRLSRENDSMSIVRDRTGENLAGAKQTLTHSAVTGLYNFSFFQQYLKEEIEGIVRNDLGQNPALIVIGMDQTERIKYRYGDKEVDQMFKNTALLLEGLQEDYQVYFKLPGSLFACYIPHTTSLRAVELAEEIRNLIASSRQYVEPVTASLGVAELQELQVSDLEAEKAPDRLYELVLERVRIAKNNGKNRVCGSSSAEETPSRCDILLVEPDDTAAEVIGTVLENMHYNTQRARDGEEALEMAAQCLPHLILSEAMLPKRDGFAMRQELLIRTDTKNIPLVFMSHLKTEDSVRRAAELGIIHYLKKPLMLAEIQGIVRHLAEKGEES